MGIRGQCFHGNASSGPHCVSAKDTDRKHHTPINIALLIYIFHSSWIHTHMHVCVHVCGCIYMCAHLSVEAGSGHQVSFSVTLRVLSVNLELTDAPRWAGPWAPGIYLFLCPQCWLQASVVMLSFCRSAGDRTQALLLVQQTLHLWGVSLAPVYLL